MSSLIVNAYSYRKVSVLSILLFPLNVIKIRVDIQIIFNTTNENNNIIAKSSTL